MHRNDCWAPSSEIQRAARGAGADQTCRISPRGSSKHHSDLPTQNRDRARSLLCLLSSWTSSDRARGCKNTVPCQNEMVHAVCTKLFEMHALSALNPSVSCRLASIFYLAHIEFDLKRFQCELLPIFLKCESSNENLVSWLLVKCQRPGCNRSSVSHGVHCPDGVMMPV